METSPVEAADDLQSTDHRARYFTHQPASVQLARHWARSVVVDVWHLADVADTVALCVDELAANAVNHTPHTVGGSTRGFLVGLTLTGSAVRVEVHDAGTALPVLQQATDDAEGGRGLLLVAALSRTWGSYPREQIGKVVWCEVSCAYAVA